MTSPVAGVLGRVALLLSGLFFLPVLLIRTQPYDGINLRTFLTSLEDCPAPCFMGIRPGVTTEDEAVAILSEHAWVLWEDESPMSFRTPFQFSWQWTEAAPAWIDPQNAALVSVNNGVVAGLNIRTTITRAESLLAMGRPDQYRLLPNNDVLTGAPILEYRYEAWYGDLGIMLLAIGECSDSETSYTWSVMLFVLAEPPDLLAAGRPLLTPCHQAVP